MKGGDAFDFVRGALHCADVIVQLAGLQNSGLVSAYLQKSLARYREAFGRCLKVLTPFKGLAPAGCFQCARGLLP